LPLEAPWRKSELKPERFAGAEAPVAPTKLVVPAAAVPASEVKKNLRRDHRIMRPSMMTNQSEAATIHCGFLACIRTGSRSKLLRH
jgi:hypothetical protein